jgi:hypothetical protein
MSYSDVVSGGVKAKQCTPVKSEYVELSENQTTVSILDGVVGQGGKIKTLLQ